MNSDTKGTIPRIKPILKVALMAALAVLAFALSLRFTTVVLANETIFMEEFDVGGQPLNLVVQAPGRVWFTLPASNAIGSLVVTSTAVYQFTPYVVPTANSEPYDLVYDGQKTIWFTQRLGNQIGRLNMETGQIDEYPIPTANSEPTGIAVAPNGMIWFSQRSGNKLGLFNPNNQTFTEYVYPIEDIQAEDVVVQPKGCVGWAMDTEGCVWTTGPNVNQVFGFTLNTQQFFYLETYDISSLQPVEEPWNATLDSSGTLWISTRAGNRVGRFMPGTVSMWRWFTLPQAASQPTGIAIHTTANAQNIWFAESGRGRAGQLMLRLNGDYISMRSRSLPSPDSQPNGIAVDTLGNVWITDGGNQKIVRWSSPYFLSIYLPSITKQAQ